MSDRPIYRSKDSWVLCYCLKCGRINYVEPHGTTAACKCSADWTEHQNLPYESRDISGTRWVGPNRVKVLSDKDHA